MRIVIEGNFARSSSYAMVNLNLGRALGLRGHDVTLVSLDVDQVELLEMTSGSDFADLAIGVGEPSRSPEVRIRQVWPPVWTSQAREDRLVVIQPWEFGSIPLSWIEGVRSADAIWVPSEYAKRGYLQSGIDPAKIWVVPNGFDPGTGLLEPRSASGRARARVAFVGGTIYRKGIDVLVKALDALEDSTLEGIDLLVKDVGADSFYANQSLLADVLAAHPRVGARTTIERRHLERDALLELISGADVLVHPYRAEGFGLPVLEAMAVGTPVIHTRGGATNEFCGPEESLLIPSTLTVADVPKVGDAVVADRSYWMEPSVEELSGLIGAVVSGQIRTEPLVSAARQRALTLSWPAVAQIAEHALEQLAAGAQPTDTLTTLVAGVDEVIADERVPPAPVLSRLVAVGDLVSAHGLASYVQRRGAAGDTAEVASVRERLGEIVQGALDVWSGGPYRVALGQATFEGAGRFGYVHDFEGDDRATYAIAQYLANYLGACDSVLDIACGQGSMLRVLRSQGKKVQGVEPDPTLVSELRADGFTVHSGYAPRDLPDIDFGRFDGVFLGHIVEHLQPAEFESLLEWIYENIEDNGTVLIQTPDFSNSGVALENFWLDSTHVRPYPVRLLKAMLSEAGFTPVEGGCRSIRDVAPLDAIALARRLPRRARPVPARTAAARRPSVGHFALFHGSSGFAQASRELLDHSRLASVGYGVVDVSLDSSATSQRRTLPLRFARELVSDVAVVDAPAGWLGEVSSLARARYRIARTTFEATPLPQSLVRTLRSFDEIWCFSHYDARIFAESGLAASSIHVMAPGIDGPDPGEVRELRASVTRTSFRFLSVFNFESRKNPEALVRAFSLVAGKVPHAELLIKTSGITDQEFTRWLRATLSPDQLDGAGDRIRVLTHDMTRESLLALYLASDVFVLPTRGEGYGLPFLEALAHGLATICPDVGGHREFCSEHNSLLVSTTKAPASVSAGSGVFRESRWRDVDLEDLVAKMLDAASEPDRLALLGERATSDAARLSVARYREASYRRLTHVLRTL